MTESYKDREQSGIKHFVLRKYLQAAPRIIGSWSAFSLVDCCAGPWQSTSATFKDTSFGVALEVLEESRKWLITQGKSPLMKALLIEKDPKAYSLLDSFAKSYPIGSIEIRTENWDFRDHTSDIRTFVSHPPSFSFMFIDPTGWTPAEIAGLGPLLKVAPGEVLINFMSSFIVRFLNDAKTNLDEVLGSDYREMRELSHEEQEDESVKRYCELIRAQGKFTYVCALPVMKPDQDAIHFFLIYASRHPKGVEVFKAVEKQTESETDVVLAQIQQKRRPSFDLFQEDVFYKRKRRYERLSVRQKRNARDATIDLIQRNTTTLYDELWATALQFATVYESDLRGWLLEAEALGEITISGRTRPDEVLKRKSNHTISRKSPLVR